MQTAASDRHRDGGLRGLDDRQADMALQAVAVTRHGVAAVVYFEQSPQGVDGFENCCKTVED